MNLLPCPFCGDRPELDGKSDSAQVRCLGCDAKGPSAYLEGDSPEECDACEEKAAQMWNRRTP